MIPRHVAAAFSPPIQTRGDAYFRKGAVHIGRLTSAHITAIVHGTVGYLVTIDASPRLLDCSCSCPYAAEHGLCKHIWAVLLAVDAERKLDGVLATAGPRAAIRATYDEEIDVASKSAWPSEPRKVFNQHEDIGTLWIATDILVHDLHRHNGDGVSSLESGTE